MKFLTNQKLPLLLSSLALLIALTAWWDLRRDDLQGGDVVASANAKGDREDSNRDGGWLKGTEDEKFRQIENQLRGLDKTMVEVGYRFTELYFAGQDRNWPYAAYQVEKIETAIKLGIERRPKRAESAQLFLNEDFPAIKSAVEKKEDKVFAEAMQQLRSACMKCHVREDVPYYTVQFPERRLTPIRSDGSPRE